MIKWKSVFRVLAEHYGISLTYVNQIKRGERGSKSAVASEVKRKLDKVEKAEERIYADLQR